MTDRCKRLLSGRAMISSSGAIVANIIGILICVNSDNPWHVLTIIWRKSDEGDQCAAPVVAFSRCQTRFHCFLGILPSSMCSELLPVSNQLATGKDRVWPGAEIQQQDGNLWFCNQ
jgi:hypothetical protein